MQHRWVMDAGARNWMIKTARANYWRVFDWLSIEDLLQEGHECFLEAERRYPQAHDPPHRMRLFQLIYMSRIHDIANRRSRCVEVRLLDVAKEAYTEPTEPDLANVALLISQAPRPIKRILKLLTTQEGCRRLRAAYRRRSDGTRELTSERLRRLIKAPQGYNAITEFERYFTKEDTSSSWPRSP